MLSVQDLLLISLTALACTSAVTLLTLLALRSARRRSLTTQFVLVVAGSVISVVSATAAIAAEMYFSRHDLQVLLWVLGIAAVLGLVSAVVTGRAARTAGRELGEAARRVGQGAVVPVQEHGSREFTEISAQLSDASRRLSQARAEIERLDASRRQFFAWISHDLRTPLTGIRALTEALDEGIAANEADYRRQIRDKVETMGRLVDDLFELSRIESGALQLRCESVALLDIVSDAVADVGALAKQRSIRLRASGIDGHMLWADPHELTRVVVNLLTNGIRHAPEHSEILITAARDNNDRLLIGILDQGPGVASEDLGRMFEVGWRAGEARTPGREATAAGGAGLGLAIVRGIVEAHGGAVHAEHVPEGFRLNISLPAAVGGVA